MSDNARQGDDAGSQPDGDEDKNADKNKQKDGGNKDDHEKDGDKKDGDKDGDDGDKKDEKPKSRWPIIIAVVLLLVAIIAGVLYWLSTRGKITTDDAYTDGRAVSIASNVSGYVFALNVDDNTYVHTGALLLTIDPRQNNAALRQAEANLVLARAQLSSAEVDLTETRVRAPAQLRQAEAQLAQARAQQFQMRRDYERQLNVDQRATAAADVDQATAQLRTADANVKQAQAQVATASLVPEMIAAAADTVQQRQAQVQQARANLSQAEVSLSYNEIRAPQDGWITRRNVELGSYVQAGQQVFYIVTPEVWISANFKETQLADMRIGDRVKMTVDAYPGLKLSGHVQSIQLGSGARFTEFPAENATGNFVKIVRRVPVKITIDDGLPPGVAGLPLGISVEPTVFVK